MGILGGTGAFIVTGADGLINWGFIAESGVVVPLVKSCEDAAGRRLVGAATVLSSDVLTGAFIFGRWAMKDDLPSGEGLLARLPGPEACGGLKFSPVQVGVKSMLSGC